MIPELNEHVWVIWLFHARVMMAILKSQKSLVRSVSSSIWSIPLPFVMASVLAKCS